MPKLGNGSQYKKDKNHGHHGHTKKAQMSGKEAHIHTGKQNYRTHNELYIPRPTNDFAVNALKKSL